MVEVEKKCWVSYKAAMKNLIHRATGVSFAFGGGMGAIAVYLVCTGISWWLYPGPFSPVKNWLSDLGNPIRNPTGARWYNVGCLLTSLALLLFVVGLSWWRSGGSVGDALIRSSQLTGIASVVSLAMIGFYSENHLRQHMVVSNWFFVCFPLFIVLLSTGLFAHPRGSKGTSLLGFGVVVIGLGFHLAFHRSRPLEWVTEVAFLMYVGRVAWNTRCHPLLRPLEP